MNIGELIKIAIDGLGRAYAPYSDFYVSVALLASDGFITTGINVENASYSATNCAERTAFYTAINRGIRKFDAIVIVGGKHGIIEDYCPPCGVCRQVMREFCDPSKFHVILAKSQEEYKEYTLEELLPMGFGPDNLK